MREILYVIGLVAIAMVLLSICVIVKKNGRFSSQHISQSRAMRQRGIHCVNTQDYEARHPKHPKIDVTQL